MQAEIKKLPTGMFGIYVNGNLISEAYSIGEANRKLEVMMGGPTMRGDQTPPPPQSFRIEKNKSSNTH